MKKILLTILILTVIFAACKTPKDGCGMSKGMIGYDDPRTHNK